MKIQVFKEQEREPVLNLRLQNSGTNGVELVIIDEYGDEDDTILEITSEGKLVRWGYIDDKHGLSLDESGRIEIEIENDI